MRGIDDNPQNRSACHCPGCPSKPEDEHLGLYCAHGLSPVKGPTTGCLCPDCRVYQEHELQEGYFCAVEPELWQRVREHARTREEREREERG